MSRAFVLCCLCAAVAVIALPQEKRASPHEKTTATVGAANITIEYGRPYVKGRKIYGGLVPYDQVWRTGADEATKLTASAPIEIGTLKVPAGTYSLFTIPGREEWTLILNKTANQWGAFKYDQSQDLGRTKMKVDRESGNPVEQLTITVDPSGTLKIAWADTVATVPIKAAQ